MSSEDIVMEIDKPHFKVKLHKTLLEVDLKEGIRKDLEDALESKPILRENLGFLFQTIIPLDVPLKNIDSVHIDKKGHVKVVIPFRKDIIIPLEPEESERLVEKLNELIPIEKEKAKRDLEESEKARKALESGRARAETESFREGVR